MLQAARAALGRLSAPSVASVSPALTTSCPVELCFDISVEHVKRFSRKHLVLLYSMPRRAVLGGPAGALEAVGAGIRLGRGALHPGRLSGLGRRPGRPPLQGRPPGQSFTLSVAVQSPAAVHPALGDLAGHRSCCASCPSAARLPYVAAEVGCKWTIHSLRDQIA